MKSSIHEQAVRSKTISGKQINRTMVLGFFDNVFNLSEKIADAAGWLAEQTGCNKGPEASFFGKYRWDRGTI